MSTDLANFKYTILITDGDPDSMPKTRNAIGQFKGKENCGNPEDPEDLEWPKTSHPDINFLTLFIAANENKIANGTYDDTFKYSDSRIYAKDDANDIQSSIVDSIYSFILWYFISINDLAYLKDSYGILDGGDYYIATIDNELLYGATLEIEYAVVILSSEEINKIEIIDNIPSNMSYDHNAKLLTEENKINANYGWNYDITTNTLKCEPNPLDKRAVLQNNQGVVAKLMLSTVIPSNTNIDDLTNYIQNTSDIIITTPNEAFFKWFYHPSSFWK